MFFPCLLSVQDDAKRIPYPALRRKKEIGKDVPAACASFQFWFANRYTLHCLGRRDFFAKMSWMVFHFSDIASEAQTRRP
jgi:hypothetical protein